MNHPCFPPNMTADNVLAKLRPLLARITNKGSNVLALGTPESGALIAAVSYLGRLPGSTVLAGPDVADVEPKEPASPGRIAVVLEGGLVQHIAADHLPGVEVVVIDYDTDGEDDQDRLYEITHETGLTSACCASRWDEVVSHGNAGKYFEAKPLGVNAGHAPEVQHDL